MDDRSLFCVYYAGLMAMRFHPGNAKDDKVCPTMEGCEAVALHMVAVTNKHFPVLTGDRYTEIIKAHMGGV